MALLKQVFLLTMFLCSALCECPYTTLETALISNASNLENLMLSFFPADRPTSIVVDVYYIINIKNKLSATPSEVTDDREEDQVPNRLHFRWIKSSINMFVEPEVLQILSLYTFRMSKQSVNLMLNLPSNCHIPNPIDKKACNETEKVVAIEGLNNLTSNMLSYAKHLHLNRSSSNELRQPENMGYSILIFDEDARTKNRTYYCVLDQSFQTIKIVLFAAVLVSGIFFCIGTPTIFGGVYQRLHNKMAAKNDSDNKKDTKDDSDSDWQFIIWGVAVVTCIASCIIVGITLSNIWRDYRLNHHVAFTHFSYATLYTVYLVGFVIATILTIVIFGCCLCHDVFASDQTKISDFPTPHIFLICFGFAKNRFIRGGVVTIACFFFTLFLELISFHGFFMILSAVAVPLVAIPRATFYTSTLICLVAFVAFFLKFSNKSGCDKICKCHQGGNNATKMSLCMYGVAVLSALALFGCVIMCGVLYYLLSRKVEDYRHSGDILSILGSFLPSLLVAFATFCGKKLMNCLKDRKTTDELDERTPLLPRPGNLEEVQVMEASCCGCWKHSNSSNIQRGDKKKKVQLVSGSGEGEIQEVISSPQGEVQEVNGSSKDQEPPSSNSDGGHHENESIMPVVTIESTSLDVMDANKQQHGSNGSSGHQLCGIEHPTGISPAPTQTQEQQ